MIGEITFPAAEALEVLELVDFAVKAVVEATEGETVVLWKLNDRHTGFLPPIGGRYWQVSGKRPRSRDLAGCVTRESLTEDCLQLTRTLEEGTCLRQSMQELTLWRTRYHHRRCIGIAR